MSPIKRWLGPACPSLGVGLLSQSVHTPSSWVDPLLMLCPPPAHSLPQGSSHTGIFLWDLFGSSSCLVPDRASRTGRGCGG